MIYIIFGPTGSGKTSFSERLCREVDGVLIAADSRQVYRNVGIGTGLSDNKIPIHLTSFLDLTENYSVSKWQKAAHYLIETTLAQKKIPIIVGGTGLYIDSLLYKREYGNNIEPLMPIEFKLLTSKLPRNEIYDNINLRVDQMFKQGFVDEVKAIINNGFGETKVLNGAGYREIVEFIENEGKTPMDFPEIINSPMPVRWPILDLETCVDKVKIAYRNYAKRQFTWFKKYHKDFEVDTF